jgi:hypothetical protein
VQKDDHAVLRGRGAHHRGQEQHGKHRPGHGRGSSSATTFR